MKKKILSLVALVSIALGLTACGKSADERALDDFKAQLTNLGYNVQSGEWVTEEESKSKRKKAAPKPTSVNPSKPNVPKPSAPKPKTKANPKDRFMEVIVLERGCRVEAEKKAGSNDFEIDEAQNNAGEEIEIDDFPELNPNAAKTRQWLDDNRERFDCHRAA